MRARVERDGHRGDMSDRRAKEGRGGDEGGDRKRRRGNDGGSAPNRERNGGSRERRDGGIHEREQWRPSRERRDMGREGGGGGGKGGRSRSGDRRAGGGGPGGFSGSSGGMSRELARTGGGGGGFGGPGGGFGGPGGSFGGGNGPRPGGGGTFGSFSGAGFGTMNYGARGGGGSGGGAAGGGWMGPGGQSGPAFDPPGMQQQRRGIERDRRNSGGGGFMPPPGISSSGYGNGSMFSGPSGGGGFGSFARGGGSVPSGGGSMGGAGPGGGSGGGRMGGGGGGGNGLARASSGGGSGGAVGSAGGRMSRANSSGGGGDAAKASSGSGMGVAMVGNKRTRSGLKRVGRQSTNRRTTFMTRAEVEKLFEKVLRERCEKPNAFPMDASLINDRMQTVEPQYSVANSEYVRFTEILAHYERQGVLTSAAFNHSVRIMTCNWWNKDGVRAAPEKETAKEASATVTAPAAETRKPRRLPMKGAYFTCEGGSGCEEMAAAVYKAMAESFRVNENGALPTVLRGREEELGAYKFDKKPGGSILQTEVEGSSSLARMRRERECVRHADIGVVIIPPQPVKKDAATRTLLGAGWSGFVCGTLSALRKYVLCLVPESVLAATENQEWWAGVLPPAMQSDKFVEVEEAKDADAAVALVKKFMKAHFPRLFEESHAEIARTGAENSGTGAGDSGWQLQRRGGKERGRDDDATGGGSVGRNGDDMDDDRRRRHGSEDSGLGEERSYRDGEGGGDNGENVARSDGGGGDVGSGEEAAGSGSGGGGGGGTDVDEVDYGEDEVDAMA